MPTSSTSNLDGIAGVKRLPNDTSSTIIRGSIVVVKDVTSLRDITRQMLNDRNPELTMAEIAEALDISRSWLTAFSRGVIPNPGVVTVETLYTYLKRMRRNG